MRGLILKHIYGISTAMDRLEAIKQQKNVAMHYLGKRQ